MLSRLLSRYWPLLPILFLVVFAIDTIETPDTVPVEETIDMRETRSDYYMSDFKTRKYNADGLAEYTVSGASLAHYPDTDHSEITQPRIVLNRPGAYWTIQSQSGQINTDPDRFTLNGNVVLQRNSEQAEPVTIKTSRLTVATDINTVSTSAPIEVVAPSWRLRAEGLYSAIDDGNFKLLADVVGRYEVPQ